VLPGLSAALAPLRGRPAREARRLSELGTQWVTVPIERNRGDEGDLVLRAAPGGAVVEFTAGVGIIDLDIKPSIHLLPNSHHNIGRVETARGKVGAAEDAYRTAVRLGPNFVPAYANLADLYRALGADAKGEEILPAGLEVAPQSADLHHALGLLHIRGKHLEDALGELRRAAELGPDNPRYPYVHALVLKETGVARYRNEIGHDIDHLVKKYCRIIGWEVPDVDDQEARKLVFQAL